MAVHVLSAVIWLGGMLFLALVVVPGTRRLVPADRTALFEVVGRRFRYLGWGCVATLIVTGLLNLGYRGVTWQSVVDGRLFTSSFGQVLALKVAFVAAMVLLTAYHDFVRHSTVAARASTLLALVVVVLAVFLVRGVPAL